MKEFATTEDLRNSWHYNIFSNLSSMMKLSGKSKKEVLELIEIFEKETPKRKSEY